eukprot:2680914-Pyramimonas_sp.AAC.1
MISVADMVFLEGIRITKVKQLHGFAVLRSHEWCFGTVQYRHDATVRLIRGAGIPMCWHASGSSNGCLPTRQFPQWK